MAVLALSLAFPAREFRIAFVGLDPVIERRGHLSHGDRQAADLVGPPPALVADGDRRCAEGPERVALGVDAVVLMAFVGIPVELETYRIVGRVAGECLSAGLPLLVDADSRRKASVYECFLAGRPDIQNGDRLTTGGVTYLVQYMGYWQDVTKVVLEREEQIG